MATTQLEVLAEGFVFLEGPRWRDERLWLSDMYGQAIHTITEAGAVSKVADVPNRPSGLNFLPDGRLVTVSMTDNKLYVVDDAGGLSDYANLSALVTGHINDSVVDTAGNIYVGNFGFDLAAGENPVPTNLVRVATDGSTAVAAEDLLFPNGTVITPEGGTLICAETFANRLTAFTRAADGTLGNRRVWADLGMRQPDGICLDEAGAVWVSCIGAGEFIRVLEGGEVAQTIKAPGKLAIACNLGSADGRTLFALTYEGELADIPSGAKNARVEVCRVEVAGSGSP